MNTIDLGKSIHELTEENPELIPVLVDLGFAGVAQPEMRSSHGKEMTIPLGCERFGLELEEVVGVLRARGFEVKS